MNGCITAVPRTHIMDFGRKHFLYFASFSCPVFSAIPVAFYSHFRSLVHHLIPQEIKVTGMLSLWAWLISLNLVISSPTHFLQMTSFVFYGCTRFHHIATEDVMFLWPLGWCHTQLLWLVQRETRACRCVCTEANFCCWIQDKNWLLLIGPPLLEDSPHCGPVSLQPTDFLP